MRRWAAAGITALGLLALTVQALRQTPDPAASLWVAARFWRASTATRLFNSPLFGRDREFAAALLAADRDLPLDRDVVLSLTPEAGGTAEEPRRVAAYVLAPRRVLLGPGTTDGRRFALGLAPAAGGGPR